MEMIAPSVERIPIQTVQHHQTSGTNQVKGRIGPADALQGFLQEPDMDVRVEK